MPFRSEIPLDPYWEKALKLNSDGFPLGCVSCAKEGGGANRDGFQSLSTISTFFTLLIVPMISRSCL